MSLWGLHVHNYCIASFSVMWGRPSCRMWCLLYCSSQSVWGLIERECVCVCVCVWVLINHALNQLSRHLIRCEHKAWNELASPLRPPPHTHIHIHIHVHTYVHTYSHHTLELKHAHMCTHTHIYTHSFTYTHTHTHTHTHTRIHVLLNGFLLGVTVSTNIL